MLWAKPETTRRRTSTSLVRSSDLVDYILGFIMTKGCTASSILSINSQEKVSRRTRVVISDVRKVVTTAVMGLTHCKQI